MPYNRRQFMQASGLFAAGSLLAKNNLFAANNKPLKDFGLQLYSVRDVLPKDPKGVLKEIASYGYTQVESFEGSQGMFWGMSPMEFKNYMDDLGMKIVANHTNIEENFDQKAADAASIGMAYLICPYKGPQKSIDDFKKIADEFNEKGEVCKKHGIRFAYHNHAYSFRPVDGEVPEDVMLTNTDPDLIDFELDMYWVVTGGADIEKYLKKYENRFKLCHVKDREKGADPNNEDASCDLGTGQIDYAAILPVAEKNGVEYYIVEQERYEGTTPMASAKADAEYLKNISV